MLGLFTIALAQSTSPGLDVASDFVARVNDAILYPLIMLLMGLALLIFLYGCFEYIQHSDDSYAREQGKNHIIWGIVGMFIMLVAYGILGIAAGTFGLDDQLDCANDPTKAGCNEIFRLPNPGGTNPGSGSNPGGTNPGSGSNPGGTPPGR